MSLDYFKNVRGVQPLACAAGVVEDYQLVFDLKGPNFLEPTFANLRSQPASYVEGVLYELTEKDYVKTCGSESRYQTIDIQVTSNGKLLTSKTLIASPDNELPPSKRCLDILVAGAIGSNLSLEYIAKLKNHNGVYYPLASELMGFIVRLFVRYKAFKNKHA